MFGHMSDVGGKTPCSMPTDAQHDLRGGRGDPAVQAVPRRACSTRTRCGSSSTRCGCPTGTAPTSTASSRRAARRRVACRRCANDSAPTPTSRALDALLQRNYDAMKVLLSDRVRGGPDAFVHRLHLRRRRRLRPVRAEDVADPHRRQGAPRLHRQLAAGRRSGQLLHQREPDPDVLRHLHDHSRRPADPLERRLLSVGRRDDSRGFVLEARVPGRAERAQPRHRSRVRPVRRPARSDQPGVAERRGLLVERRTSCTRATTRPAIARGSGSSCTRSASAASPGVRSATGPTVTRCGPASSTSRASTWSPTTRCGSRSGRRSPTPAAPDCIAAATASTSRTCSTSPGTIAIHDDRWLTYPWGVNGGEPGARGTKWIERADGTREVLPSKCHDVPVGPGDVLHFVTWGGGGWGDPLERDPALVALEVRRGLVTAEGGAALRGRAWRGGTATPTRPSRCGREMRGAARRSCRCSTWARRWRRSWRTCEARRAYPRRSRPVWT